MGRLDSMRPNLCCRLMEAVGAPRFKERRIAGNLSGKELLRVCAWVEAARKQINSQTEMIQAFQARAENLKGILASIDGGKGDEKVVNELVVELQKIGSIATGV